MLEFSYKQNIIIVSPTTLFSSLHVIANIRRLEKQEENVNNIVEEVEKFYHKCCLFLEDYLIVGKIIEKASESFDLSMNKMQNGRGNLIDKMKKICFALFHIRYKMVDSSNKCNRRQIVKFFSEHLGMRCKTKSLSGSVI